MKDNLKIPKARIEEEDKLRTQIIDSQIVGTADEEQHILMIFLYIKYLRQLKCNINANLNTNTLFLNH